MEAIKSNKMRKLNPEDAVSMRKFKITNSKKELQIDELEVAETATLGDMYVLLAQQLDVLVQQKGLQHEKLSSSECAWKFWTAIEGVAGKLHNVFGNAVVAKLMIKDAFPKHKNEFPTIKLMKGPKVTQEQLENAKAQHKMSAEQTKQERLEKQQGDLMKGYKELGVNMESRIGSCGGPLASVDNPGREYLQCQFSGRDGVKTGGRGPFDRLNLGNFRILNGRNNDAEPEADLEAERHMDNVVAELGRRWTRDRPASDPQSSWPPRMEVVPDIEELETFGKLFNYARKEKVMRVIAEDRSSNCGRVVLAVKATVQLSRGRINEIVNSIEFSERKDGRIQAGGNQDGLEIFNDTNIQNFRTVWDRVFMLAGGGDQLSMEELLTADDLIEQYARSLDGSLEMDQRGYLLRKGKICKDAENSDAYLKGRLAIRIFFRAYGDPFWHPMVLQSISLKFSAGIDPTTARQGTALLDAQNVAQQIDAKIHEMLLSANIQASTSLNLEFRLLEPNLQYAIDERSYGEYLNWAEMPSDYERCWQNPQELPQWGRRFGHKVRIFGTARDLFPADRIGIDPRNGHFFEGFEPGSQQEGILLLTTVGATQKTRAKIGLLILALVGRLEGPEKENHKVMKKFMSNIRGDERRGAAINRDITVQQQADAEEQDPWNTSSAQIDLPTLPNFPAKVSHYMIQMDAVPDHLGVRRASLRYRAAGGMGGGVEVVWKVYEERSNVPNSTIFEVEKDNFSFDKSFHMDFNEFGQSWTVGAHE